MLQEPWDLHFCGWEGFLGLNTGFYLPHWRYSQNVKQSLSNSTKKYVCYQGMWGANYIPSSIFQIVAAIFVIFVFVCDSFYSIITTVYVLFSLFCVLYFFFEVFFAIIILSILCLTYYFGCMYYGFLPSLAVHLVVCYDDISLLMTWLHRLLSEYLRRPCRCQAGAWYNLGVSGYLRWDFGAPK
jgi:hypothetical protein